jgi:flagellar biosynthesis/type III secretory pathway protein FliH
MAESTEKKTLAERAVTLSDERLKSLEANRRNAMQAVCKFLDDVDEAIPATVDPSIRKRIVDLALELADKLGATQLEFQRSVSSSVSEALTPRRPGSAPASEEVRATQGELFDQRRR